MAGWQVALLRGVNVGRAKRLGMAELRGLVERLGYTDVRTHLNSGNVVFRGGSRGPAAASRIEAAIAADLGVSCRVIVIRGSQLSTIVTENPLLKIATNPSRLLVDVLGQPSDRAAITPLLERDWGKEALGVGTFAVYLWVAEGVIKSPLNDAVNKALRHNVTGRNWTTMLKLRDMAS